MSSPIKIDEIYGSNVNFLVGAGASYGLFPTLALKVKDEAQAEKKQTIETLATHFDRIENKTLHTLLFMHYYRTCIHPACMFSVESATGDEQLAVLANYRRFIETLLQMIDRRKPMEKRCNIFTTNYDGLFALVAEDILASGTSDFCINDGTRGFRRKLLNARNFSSFLCQSGVFDQHRTSVPQLNLIHLHGSVYWRKWRAGIEVNYGLRAAEDLIPAPVSDLVNEYSAMQGDDGATIDSLITRKFEVDSQHAAAFWSTYNSLPIVNPTKWKFHETVFEEHYYQMLRLLSYELEKPNAILVTFGFSFADEHILHLVMRSLSNPRLQAFVCCFNAAELEWMKQQFSMFKNVQFIDAGENNLDFTFFNDKVFSLQEYSEADLVPQINPGSATEAASGAAP